MACKTSAIDVATLMGELLLKNGAEITRVQETMERIALAYNIDKFNVYVLTNGIFVNGTEEGVNHKTEITFVRSFTIHLGRIMAINQLSREICTGTVSTEDAYEKAKEIENIPYSSKKLLTIATGIGSAGFCFIYGGTIVDSFVALICGCLVQLFLNLVSDKNISKVIINILASGLVTICAIILGLLGIGDNLDMIIVGSIIRLVPGMLLTTSIRDFFNSDYLSGTIRLIDALMVGGGIAVGVGVVIKCYSIFLGGGML